MNSFLTLPLLTRLFPLWAVLISALAILFPAAFHPLGPWITTLLALVMFSMGLTLRTADFRRIALRPAPVLAGLGLHYLIMPLAAWGLAHLLGLPLELAAGTVLVGSVPSGTASTVMVSMVGRRCRIAGAFLLFVVDTRPPRATVRKAGRVNPASELSGCWHGGCCDLILPRPRDGTSGAGSVERLWRVTP